MQAPFGKLLMSLEDENFYAPWHGHVTNSFGICEVTEAVPLPALLERANDHRWVLSLVRHALGCVVSANGWRSRELEEEVRKFEARSAPLVHFFSGLIQEDRISGVRCEPWFSAEPGITRVGVSLVSHGERQEVTVFSKAGSAYLEDDFPVAKTAIRKACFRFLDRAGKTLASVPLGAALTH